ncbi:type I glyceraldehyde-3-phosphate dehydrogenase [Candidatus Peregrinibacteria bacterium CG11_big_fil_rev_8_21_14_0_20_46_8]|nr:MAG: type I glyceraldehyde-3-phosphate dehydrogenase [Candidatus Peregrinibacteria bacterium CG11_big_fil_rev_8_21_14_0_20_46_8]
MAKPRVAINGFGRIGKVMFRTNLIHDLVDIVAVNDLSDAEQHAHLLKYDSSYGVLDADIQVKDGVLAVNGKEIRCISSREPNKIPWKEIGVDVVLEATGFFEDRESASKHIEAGAKKVIITAPGKDDDLTVVMGVNDDQLDPAKHTIISNASCTTNCLAPVVKVLDDAFGIEQGFMTTIHSYTNDQSILDRIHPKDFRRARAAAVSLIPTSTGAAKAIGRVLPHLDGKLNGVAVRAPTPVVSLVDFVAYVKNPPKNMEEVNAKMREAADGRLKGILQVEDAPLVSVDFKQNPHSSIVDSALTMVDGNMVKVFSWYDNEWGYSTRVIELAAKFGA